MLSGFFVVSMHPINDSDSATNAANNIVVFTPPLLVLFETTHLMLNQNLIFF